MSSKAGPHQAYTGKRSGKRREAQAINFHNVVSSLIILYNQTTSVLHAYLHVHSLTIFE